MAENHGAPEAGKLPEVVERQGVAKEQAAKVRNRRVNNEMRSFLRRTTAGAA